jgi:hypothetical protein
MKTAGLAALLMIASTTGSFAEGAHAAHGLYCRTEAQVNAAVAAIQRGVPPPLAAELVNRDEVACVYADRIWYVIDQPAMIGQAKHGGVSLIKYEGMLVGVLVGKNPRPIEPPVHLYFVVPEPIPGVAEAGGA